MTILPIISFTLNLKCKIGPSSDSGGFCGSEELTHAFVLRNKLKTMETDRLRLQLSTFSRRNIFVVLGWFYESLQPEEIFENCYNLPLFQDYSPIVDI